LPGIIEDPACTAGRTSSPNPALGPDESNRKSLEAFASGSAVDIVVRVAVLVLAVAVPEVHQRAVCYDLVYVHVGRRARAALQQWDDEVSAHVRGAGSEFLACGRDRGSDKGRQRSAVEVCPRGCELHHPERSAQFPDIGHPRTDAREIR
jgi:hypothetical protein